ncbi:MAG: class I SAM-dependent methyltransferase, partial [Planctomycetota bacterium]
SPEAPLEHGNYSTLAREYAAHRAGYAPAVVDALVATAAADAHERAAELDVADVGAGTGIFARMLAQRGCRVTAVEPDDAMRARGAADASSGAIRWQAGRAEDTRLPARAFDLVTMASAFHWADFEPALAEFARVLRPRAWLGLAWNTRVVDASPLLREVEAELRARAPHYVPRASGRSALCEGLTERLRASGRFETVAYTEGTHSERMSPERYLGLWRSVNDVRVQAGEAAFAGFLAWVERRVRDAGAIDAPYLTRCWSARLR